jgi:hypothetical protein
MINIYKQWSTSISNDQHLSAMIIIYQQWSSSISNDQHLTAMIIIYQRWAVTVASILRCMCIYTCIHWQSDIDRILSPALLQHILPIHYTYLPTYLSTYLPIHLPIFLPIFLPTYLPIYRPIYPSTYLSIYQPTWDTHSFNHFHFAHLR